MTSTTDRIRALVHGLKAPSALVALAANLVPAVCALLFGWSVGILILLYWAENMVIGAFQALRILITGLSRGRAGLPVALFVTPFFAVHYGLFCLGHGAFVLLYLTLERSGGWTGAGFETLAADTPRFLLSQSGLLVSLGVMAGLQAVDFLRWLLRRGWGATDARTLMAEPYGRIIALHVTLISTAFLLAWLGSPRYGVLLLALFKTLFEGAMAGRKAAGPAAGSPPTGSVS